MRSGGGRRGAGHIFDADIVLVGHSGGAALLLAVLEHLDTTVAQAVLVAGYSTRPNADKAHVRDLVFVNSPR